MSNIAKCRRCGTQIEWDNEKPQIYDILLRLGSKEVGLRSWGPTFSKAICVKCWESDDQEDYQ